MIEQPGGVVRQLLQSLLDSLDVAPLDDLVTDEQVLDRTTLLVSVCNAANAELTRTVRKAENMQAPERDGLKSMASWLRGHLRLSHQDAKRIVHNGRALERLPAVAHAFAAGAVTASQVAVIAPIAAVDVQAEAVGQGVDLAVIDELLVDVSTAQVHDQLGKVVRRFLDRLNPDGPQPDPTEGRRLWLTRHDDGSVSGGFDLDAVGGEKVQAMLESFVQADRPAADTRTRAQQLGDALVQCADLLLASGKLPILRTVKPHVIAMINIEDLVDPHTGPGAAEMGFGAVISAARARWLACDGNVSRIVMGPEGQVLDHGRSKRIVPPGLRRAVEVQERHCVFAGCQAPTHWCDVHHVQEWVLDEGETSLENSALLCERHHTKVHHGFRVERQPDGRWRTYRPDDTEIIVGEPLFAGR